VREWNPVPVRSFRSWQRNQQDRRPRWGADDYLTKPSAKATPRPAPRAAASHQARSPIAQLPLRAHDGMRAPTGEEDTVVKLTSMEYGCCNFSSLIAKRCLRTGQICANCGAQGGDTDALSGTYLCACAANSRTTSMRRLFRTESVRLPVCDRTQPRGLIGRSVRSIL